MGYAIFALCAVAGWGLAQPVLGVLRNVASTRALRMAKGR